MEWLEHRFINSGANSGLQGPAVTVIDFYIAELNWDQVELDVYEEGQV